MDTRFSVAIHILVMISESDKNLTSQELAQSVGTNSSYIRKIIGLLKKADLVVSNQGISGYKLSKKSTEITLLDIYYASLEKNNVSILQKHKNSNGECPVGKNIEKSLDKIFYEVEDSFSNAMLTKTLDDVIDDLYNSANIVR